jgi:hypothetical protein
VISRSTARFAGLGAVGSRAANAQRVHGASARPLSAADEARRASFLDCRDGLGEAGVSGLCAGVVVRRVDRLVDVTLPPTACALMGDCIGRSIGKCVGTQVRGLLRGP